MLRLFERKINFLNFQGIKNFGVKTTQAIYLRKQQVDKQTYTREIIRNLNKDP